jgi:hypothetical protein
MPPCAFRIGAAEWNRDYIFTNLLASSLLQRTAINSEQGPQQHAGACSPSAVVTLPRYVVFRPGLLERSVHHPRNVNFVLRIWWHREGAKFDLRARPD